MCHSMMVDMVGMTSSLMEHMKAVLAGTECPFESEPFIYPNRLW